MRVREAILTTQHDAFKLAELESDLRAVADAIDASPAQLRAQYVAYEASDACYRLADFTLRRRRDSQIYRRYVRRRGLAESGSDPSAELDELHREVVFEHLRDSRSALDSGDGLTLLSDFGVMRLEAGLWSSTETSWSMMTLADNGAHMYWRQRTGSEGSVAPSTTTATVHVVLADDPPSLSGSVAPWLAVLVTVVVAMGYLLFDNLRWLWPWNNPVRASSTDGQADALVAVLLVVPGVVFHALGFLPRTSTVAGQLNFFDRLIAQLAVIVAGAIGLTLARGTQRITRSIWGSG